jgi:hypothetical protein
MKQDEKDFILEAAGYLEDPGAFIRAVGVLGNPLERLQDKLPAPAHDAIAKATQKALEKALEAAIKSIPEGEVSQRAEAIDFTAAGARAGETGLLHTVSAAVSGAASGVFGLASLPIELPLTTTIMLRSIARTAREFGADLSKPEERLECLYVFTLGTRSKDDDAAETGYYASRLAFMQLLREATAYLSSKTASEALKAMATGSAPILVRVMGAIAGRFQIAVTQKMVAGAVPVIGAVGAAALNAAFTQHFSKAARYHFGLRRLERVYGKEAVERLYAVGYSR